MSKLKWQGRLPNGEITTNQDEYVDAWRSLGKRIEALFKGYQVYGYDPGISLYRQDEHNRRHSLNLSMDNIKALLGEVRMLRKTRLSAKFEGK